MALVGPTYDTSAGIGNESLPVLAVSCLPRDLQRHMDCVVRVKMANASQHKSQTMVIHPEVNDTEK
jgi:hypothetical protein